MSNPTDADVLAYGRHSIYAAVSVPLVTVHLHAADLAPARIPYGRDVIRLYLPRRNRV